MSRQEETGTSGINKSNSTHQGPALAGVHNKDSGLLLRGNLLTTQFVCVAFRCALTSFCTLILFGPSVAQKVVQVVY